MNKQTIAINNHIIHLQNTIASFEKKNLELITELNSKKESDKNNKELGEKIKQLENKLREYEEIHKESGEKLRESEEKQKESDKNNKELADKLRELGEKSDKYIAHLETELSQQSAKLNKLEPEYQEMTVILSNLKMENNLLTQKLTERE